MFCFAFYKSSWLTCRCYGMVKSMPWYTLCTQVITEISGVYVAMYGILHSLTGWSVSLSRIWSSLTLSGYHLRFLVSHNRFLSSFIYVSFDPALFSFSISRFPSAACTPGSVGFWPHWSGGSWLDDFLVLRAGQDTTRGDGGVWDICVVREQLYELVLVLQSCSFCFLSWDGWDGRLRVSLKYHSLNCWLPEFILGSTYS